MNNKKLWQLKNLRDQITGVTPVKNLFLTLHSTDSGQEYCVLKLIYQSESSFGYVVSRLQSTDNGDIIEMVTDTKDFQYPQYESEFDYNSGYKTSYLVPLKNALPYLNIKNSICISSSKISEIKKKYNELFGFKKSNQQIIKKH